MNGIKWPYINRQPGVLTPIKVRLWAPTYDWLVDTPPCRTSIERGPFVDGYTWLKIFEASNLTNLQYMSGKRNDSYPCEFID